SAPASALFSAALTPPTHLSPLSLHDALPICSTTGAEAGPAVSRPALTPASGPSHAPIRFPAAPQPGLLVSDPTTPGRNTQVEPRSEEHTSELQSPYDLVCRLLLEKKKIDQ